ncbi:ATP-binding cassette domain-containing protein [Ensifer canadensis]
MTYSQPRTDTAQGRLEFRSVTKRYGPTVALSEFTHDFTPGRVHALMGKNGSGKSTLIKLLAGVTEPTSGTISVNGRDQSFTSPHDAFDAGIVTVHQELSLVPELSVGENIFLGRLPHTRRAGFRVVDWKGLHQARDRASVRHGAFDRFPPAGLSPQRRATAGRRDRQSDVLQPIDPAA